MNFFQTLIDLQAAGDWNITIKQAQENKLIVSVLFRNEKCGDNAGKLIPPLILKGSALEMDEGFFEAIGEPIKNTATLLVNLEAYCKQQEQAKTESKLGREQETKEQREKESKGKKYDEALKQVSALEAEGKYREAWMKVPDHTEYPEKEDFLRKRKEALSAKFSQPTFF